MKQPSYRTIAREFLAQQDKIKAKHAQRFFKTGKGEYAEGDIFLGLTVPEVRVMVKKYRKELSLADITHLIESKYHELRLFALLVLVAQYRDAGDAKKKKEIFTLYAKHTTYINNWDLVDTSAPQIVGDYIANHMEHRARLAFINKYCASKSLWENRIIVLASFYQIRKGDAEMLLYVARKLMHHPHDLMHKAIGWMLREVGKQNREALKSFLDEHAGTMPRTMLRYSIEHFSQQERGIYLKRKTAEK